MMTNSKLVLIVFLLYFQNFYSQIYTIHPSSKWVKSIPLNYLPDKSKNSSKAGFYLTLGNYQYNLDSNQSYVNEIRVVSSYSGVTEASQLLVSFDSSYQKLRIHHLFIWRNGEKIDRTESINFQILNNELNLAQGLYHGNVSVYQNLDDIRKDDLIDFSYTIEGNNPILNNEKYLLIPLADITPIDYFYLRIIYSSSNKYKYRCNQCDSGILIVDTTDNGFKQIEISRRNIEALQLEENMPSKKLPCPYWSLSSFDNWNDVNLWAQSLFVLSESVNLDTILNEVIQKTDNIDEKINKIIDFVQNDVRYMGIESGIGSHKPSNPATVATRRFGDCKDKSLLLISLLKKIGIANSFPVLVNTNYKNETSKMQPSNEIFDHCIVKFDYNGTTYWIDPTHTLQGGGYRNSIIENYEKVLIVGIQSDTLSTMTDKDTISKIKFEDHYFVKSFSDPVRLIMTSLRFGRDADIKRIQMEKTSQIEISKSVLDDLRLKFEDVKEDSASIIEDNIGNNIVQCKYSYLIGDFWKDGNKLDSKNFAGYWLFVFEPQTILQALSGFDCSKRINDYEMSIPFCLESKYVFHLPKDILILDNYRSFDNLAFTYSDTIEQLNHNTFQISYRFNTKLSTISAKDYENICKEKEGIIKSSTRAIFFKKQ